MKKSFLITGAAGFIGFHVCLDLLKLGHNVVGLDNINDYYDVNLKLSRLKNLGINQQKAKVFNKISTSNTYKNMKFIRLNLEDRVNLPIFFNEFKFDAVCNLAAQAGVRYSLINPEVYIDSNIVGFLNVIECCRNQKINKLVYASTSSVYGNCDDFPLRESTDVSFPISLYAASKKSNELIAHCYSKLFDINTIALRFFTVYGPWGRPDMAPFLFTDAIIKKKPIDIFNNGDLYRDFTYIDDIVNGVTDCLLKKPKSEGKYKTFNIGNGNPLNLMQFINTIEDILGIKSIKNFLPMQPGDVKKTWASTKKINQEYGYVSKTDIKKGIGEFISWYKSYYKI
jgi:UDP-glucuronate 4-epimerase